MTGSTKKLTIRVILCLFAVVSIFLAGSAQAENPPVLDWQTDLVATGHMDMIREMRTDPSGDVYVTGWKQLTPLDGPTLRSVALLKLSSSGQVLWATYTPAGHLNGEEDVWCDASGEKIVFDQMGNIYVTGIATCSLQGGDMLAVKYSSDGTIHWISRYSTPNDPYNLCSVDGSNAIDVDANGNVYVAGGVDLCEDGNFALATVKFDPDGVFQWERREESFGRTRFGLSSGSLIKVGVDGNVNVFGHYVDRTCYTCQPSSIGLISKKYDPAGNPLNTTTITGFVGGAPNLAGAEEDASGNIYVASSGPLGGDGRDYLVAKYAPDGNIAWTKTYDSGSDDVALSLALSPADNSAVFTGSNFGPVKYDSGGVFQWARTPYPGKIAYKVKVNQTGDVFVGGQTGVGTQVRSTFIKFNPYGDQLWHVDAIQGVAAVKAAFRTIDLGSNGQDVYLATAHIVFKFRPENQSPLVTIGGPYSMNEGESVVLSATGSDPDGDTLTYAWDLDNNGTFETSGQSVTIAAHDGPASYQVSVQVTDTAGLTATDQTTITVRNVAPSAVFENTSGEIFEGGMALITATGQYDPGLMDTAAGFSYSYDCTNDGTFELSDSPNASYSCSYMDNGIYTAKGRIADKDGGFNEYIVEVTVDNVAPTVGAITAPTDPAAVNTTLNVSAQFTDPGILDTHTAVWNWGDGSFSDGNVNEIGGSGTVSGSHSYTEAGVYTVTLTVTDKDGASAESIFKYVVVYDPSAGFVTGGGWINSPSGAYNPNLSIAGKANFGFVAKYKKGATVPDGQTEFNFSVANLNFHSTSYQWLVVAGAHAKYKGSGTINGIGDYGFMLTATDGQQNGGGGTDAFRIKIWDKGSGTIIYDNQMGASDDSNMGTVLGGGSIVIHNK